MSFHDGKQYDCERNERGDLEVYRTPVTGFPSKTGLTGDMAEPTIRVQSELEARVRAAIRKIGLELAEAFTVERNSEGQLEIYRVPKISGVPAKSVGDARYPLTPVQRWQRWIEAHRRGEPTGIELLRLEADRRAAADYRK